jgi:hypothetical protein
MRFPIDEVGFWRVVADQIASVRGDLRTDSAVSEIGEVEATDED